MFRNIIILFIVLTVWSCKNKTASNNLVVPTNLKIGAHIEKGRTGDVTITPTAENALNFEVFFARGLDPEVTIPGDSITFRYKKSGKYSVLITVVAYGVGGTSISKNIELDMDVQLMIAPETLKKIAGNGSKRWIWERGVGGHLGVGPITNKEPEFFSVKPNNMDPCIYDDVLVFNYDAKGNYIFELLTGVNNQTYINWAEITHFFPDVMPVQFTDECRDVTDQLKTKTNFSIYDNSQGNHMLRVENSTMSYWSGAQEYEIMELTDNKLKVRGIQEVAAEFGGGVLAWYHTFVPETSKGSNYIGELPFDKLVWSEEFNEDGALDISKWNYVLGDGCPDLCGWGNHELQTYTDDAANIIKKDGVLKITAKAENGKYTSARINTKNVFDFVYGKVSIRAKLPDGKGSWPAIWMLGSNIDKLGWPICGEIDIVEHIGNKLDKVWSSVHTPDNFSENAIYKSTRVRGASKDFHIYEVEWTSDKMIFSIDGKPYHEYSYTPNQPFYNKDFFLVLNIAMGGTKGGTVDSNFSSSTMEIDYIRVYQ